MSGGLPLIGYAEHEIQSAIRNSDSFKVLKKNGCSFTCIYNEEKSQTVARLILKVLTETHQQIKLEI